MKAERQVWFQPTSPSPPLVYRQLFPAQVQCVCTRPSSGLDKVSAKQRVVWPQSSCCETRAHHRPEGAGGAGRWCPRSAPNALLGEQRGQLLPPQASGDLGRQRWGRPAPSPQPGHLCQERPAGAASGLLGGPQQPPSAHPVCQGCHRPGPRGGLEPGPVCPQSRSFPPLGGGRP